MTPKRFFRLCLLLPLVVPLALMAFEPTRLSALLWTASIIGGLPYLAFAVVLFVWFGRLCSLGQFQLLSICAPLLFLPFLGSYLVLVALDSTSLAEASSKAWNLVLELSGFILLVGYVYVTLANAMPLFLKWLGALKDSNPDKRSEPTE